MTGTSRYPYGQDIPPALLRRRAAESPDRPFLTMDGETYTYGSLEQGTRVAAGYLASSGIARGDRVGIMLDNGSQFLHIWFGVCRLGAIEVPINTAVKHSHLQYIIANSAMRLLFIEAAYFDRLAEIELPETLERVIVFSDQPPVGEIGGVECVGWSLIAERGEADFTEPEQTIADPAAIVYTSGTTGPSKGVVCPHGHLMSLGIDSLELLKVGPDDVLYDAHPLYHAHSQGQAVCAAMVADIPLVMRRIFSASGFVADIAKYGVTTAYLIGAAGLVLKQPPSPFDRDNRLRVICAVPVPKGQLDALQERFGVPVVDLYGMSEMGVITSNPLSATVEGSCGKPSPYREIGIIDDGGHEVPQGETGQIVVRTRRPWATFLEYWGMPEKTLEATRNMWFHTGDSGRLDENGYLHFVGRIKDSIRRRGENISAFEVEQVINAHGEILESAVMPYPSEVGEDDVWVVAVVRSGSTLTAEILAEYCRAKLPRYAVPRYIQFERDLPKTPTQRIEKYKIRQNGLGEHAVDCEAAGMAGS